MAKKQKYYDGTKIRAQKADVNIIFGEKSNGKSYDVKHYVLRDYANTGKQFVLVRRNKMDVTAAKMARYLADVDVKSVFPEYDVIYANAGTIYVAQLDDDGFRRHAQTVGYYMALTDAQHVSGGQYPNVRNVIVEEFAAIGEGAYLPDELTYYDILLSNILRRRPDYKIWLLGNTLSRICPYFDYYGVTKIVHRMKIGTIETVERDTDAGVQKIAIEYCENAGATTNLFVKGRGAMINDGRWHVEAQPRLPSPRSEWQKHYTAVIEYNEYKWLLEVISNKGDYVVYVTTKTTPVKPKTRLISNRFTPSRYHTYTLTPLCRADKIMLDLMRLGKLCFSDDLTGTEFRQAMKNFS